MLFLDGDIKKILADEGFLEETSWVWYLGNISQRKSGELCARRHLPTSETISQSHSLCIAWLVLVHRNTWGVIPLPQPSSTHMNLEGAKRS